MSKLFERLTRLARDQAPDHDWCTTLDPFHGQAPWNRLGRGKAAGSESGAEQGPDSDLRSADQRQDKGGGRAW